MPLENLTPATRIEAYLAKIAGEDIITPEVKTRIEYYLNEIAQNGGGGGAGLPAVTEADDGKVLGVVGGEWDKMDKGWNVTNIYNTILSERTITTETSPETGYSSALITDIGDAHLEVGKTYIVNYDGNEYVVTCREDSGIPVIGASRTGETFDWEEYPFVIGHLASPSSSAFELLTDVAGTDDLEIIEVTSDVEVNNEFAQVRGYTIQRNYVLIDEEQIVSQDTHGNALQEMGYGVLEPGEKYRVTYDNVEYVLECKQWVHPEYDYYTVAYLGDFYGDDISFDNYPFVITDDPQEQVSIIYTQNPGGHLVQIDKISEKTHTTPDFDAAVQSVKGVDAPLIVHGTYVDDIPYFKGDGFEYTYEQLAEIVDSGRPVYLRTDEDFIGAVVSEFDLHIHSFTTLDNVALIIHEEELGQGVLKARFTIVGYNASSEFQMYVMEMSHRAGEEYADVDVVWPSGQ